MVSPRGYGFFALLSAPLSIPDVTDLCREIELITHEAIRVTDLFARESRSSTCSKKKFSPNSALIFVLLSSHGSNCSREHGLLYFFNSNIDEKRESEHFIKRVDKSWKNMF